MVPALLSLSRSLEKERYDIAVLVNPFILPIVGKRDLGFMREISFVTAWQDPRLVIGFAFGLP